MSAPNTFSLVVNLWLWPMAYSSIVMW